MINVCATKLIGVCCVIWPYFMWHKSTNSKCVPILNVGITTAVFSVIHKYKTSY